MQSSIPPAAQIIAVAAGKGGVGKTTTAVALASGLARRHRVVLVDLDPLGHCAVALGAEDGPGIYNWLVRNQGLPSLLRRQIRPGLDLLPGNGETKHVEQIMAIRPDMRSVDLAMQIRASLHGYDYVVLDTAPAGAMQEVALLTAGAHVTPAALGYLGIQGVSDILSLRMALHVRAAFYILPVMADYRLSRHRATLIQLRAFAESVGAYYLDPVPLREEMQWILSAGQTIWEYEPRRHHRAALAAVREAYEGLVASVEIGDGEKKHE